MARLGFAVTGVDAGGAQHRRRRACTPRSQGLAIDYRQATAEALAAERARSSTSCWRSEIVEHVADVDAVPAIAARGWSSPAALMFLSTLNRTAKAWALAIVGAEYVLRWLPRGTHDWKKFLKPSEVVRGLRAGGVETQEIVGVVYSPLSRAWSLNKRDLDVNYMLYGVAGH